MPIEHAALPMPEDPDDYNHNFMFDLVIGARDKILDPLPEGMRADLIPLLNQMAAETMDIMEIRYEIRETFTPDDDGSGKFQEEVYYDVHSLQHDFFEYVSS